MRADDDDEGWAQELEYRRRRNHQWALLRHPDPRDPDHPEPLEAEEDE